MVLRGQGLAIVSRLGSQARSQGGRALGFGVQERYKTCRMNTRRVVAQIGSEAEFVEGELVMCKGEPSSPICDSMAFAAGVAYERVVDSSPLLGAVRANIIGMAVKLITETFA